MNTETNYRYEYKVGGAVELDNATYVKREADDILYDSLKAGEFCYVLNSRQMGKTSLLNRTKYRLEGEEFACVDIDISGVIGTKLDNLTQWYNTFIAIIADHFNLEFSTLDDENHSPSLQWQLMKWFEKFLSEVEGNIIILVDEIDSVLDLKFQADDFFAFIRACYNKRSSDFKYKRLTFALFGVATPSYLIQDARRTPFNIGKAIELSGFQYSEVGQLIQGLVGKVNNPETVLQAILNWTGGQPFLTQKLCQLISETASSISIPDEALYVEQLVRSKMIENWESQDHPEHLKTINNRILRNEQRTGRGLELYKQILQTEQVVAAGSSEQMELQLSGLVVKQYGRLTVYNPIYKAVFNQEWVNETLAQLRPYTKALTTWLASDRQEKSCLLRGRKLQEALEWVEGKSLNNEDYQFLVASQVEINHEEERKLPKSLELLSKSFFWSILVTVFGLMPACLLLVSQVMQGSINTAFEAIMMSGILPIFSTTIVSALITEHFIFYQKINFRKKPIMWFLFVLFPTMILIMCITIFNMIYGMPLEKVDFEMLVTIEMMILFLTMIYAILVKTLSMYNINN
jgi:hypothetical protein